MPAEVEKMAYKGAVPWHGLGRKVEGFMTAEDAIAAAELDWEVRLDPVVVNQKVMDEYKAVVRTTDGAVYGIVGNRYTPIQNRAAFKFFDTVVGGGFAMYETVGSLNGGRRIWILANLKESIGIIGDEVKKYVVLTNSHDGTLALQMFNTPIRVVCQNTLQAALASATNKFYTRHTARAMAKIDEAQEILGLTNKFYADFKEKMEILAVKQLPQADVPLMLAAAFGTAGALRPEDVYQPVKVQIDKVAELVEVDRREFAPILHGTVYEAFNAVVKFTDYYRDYRGNNDNARLNGVWFGGGNIIKNRALKWALDYAK